MQILRQDDNMETSSYLYMSKRKKLIKPLRKMEKRSSSDSSISADSLELGRRRKAVEKQKSDDNVETILVPFYENDVLIKVPKSYKKNQNGNKSDKFKRDVQSNYLVNKNNLKRPSYLEMFRRQFSPGRTKESAYDECEVNSLLPEFGDTERESIGEEPNNENVSSNDYYNTESYNELFYERILQQDAAIYLDNSLEQALLFRTDIRSKTSEDADDNNLKSVSEVDPLRRRSRTANVQPIMNIKLTALGPDLEKIKPRLERARSLQRYSEKVRMENRLKIYKAKIQADEKKNEDSASSARRPVKTAKDRHVSPSYLVNKGEVHKAEDKKNILTRKIYQSKSANVHKIRNESNEKQDVEVDRTRNKMGDNLNKESVSRVKTNLRKIVDKNREKELKPSETKGKSIRLLSGKSVASTTEDKTDTAKVPPVQISFLVNVGGVRPSSALRRLEEKHRMYQERVKAFKDNNNT